MDLHDLTAAYALDALGPAHRFETALRADRRGNLYIDPSLDPTLDAAALAGAWKLKTGIPEARTAATNIAAAWSTVASWSSSFDPKWAKRPLLDIPVASASRPIDSGSSPSIGHSSSSVCSNRSSGSAGTSGC